jgi:uncharacterized OB-fold protein
MGLENFGTVSFTSETKAEDFVGFLKEGKVKTTQCRKCSKSYFPPRMDCSACGSSEMNWIDVNDPGELIAFSTIMYGPTGFEKEVPYTIAVIKLPSGIQIFGQIDKKIPIDEVRVGMTLKVVPVKLLDDRFSYQFEKV